MSLFAGGRPGWIDGATSAQLRRWFDIGTINRGLDYAANRRVKEIDIYEDDSITAQVAGSGRKQYFVQVNPPGPSSISPMDLDIPFGELDNSCSCPMSYDCKHVVAVLVTVRDALPKQAAGPNWAEVLSVLLPEPNPEPRAPLGLRVEFSQTRYDSHPQPFLKPATKPKAKWIKTGASWRDIEYDYNYRNPLDPTGRKALRGLLLYARSQQSALHSYGEPSMRLADLGPGVWPMLRQIVEAGVTLLGPDERTELVFQPEPATFVFDIRQDAQNQPTLTGEILRANGEALPTSAVLLGDPVHGYFLQSPGTLEIGAITPSMPTSVAQLLHTQGLTIPEEDLPSFQFNFYPALKQLTRVESSDNSVALPEVLPPRLRLDVMFEPDHLTTLVWTFSYQVGNKCAIFPVTDVSELSRDRGAEIELLRELAELGGNDYWGPLLDNQVRYTTVELQGMASSEFVREHLPRLADHPHIDVFTEGDPAEYTHVDEPAQIAISTTDSTSADWFDLDVTVSIAGHEVELARLLLALGNNEEYLLLDNGVSFRLDQPELWQLRELLAEARELSESPTGGLRISRLQVGLWEELVSLGVVAQQSSRWQQSITGLLRDQPPAPAELPEDFGTELRPYQLQGFHWLCQLWDLGLGGVLADDMGLGKTVQTLALASRAAAAGQLSQAGTPLLIVAPTSVVSSWAEQSARFCPTLVTRTVTETEGRREVPLAELAAGADVVVTSYALFRIDAEVYQQQHWAGLVLDEAQFVKNHQSKTYQAARKLDVACKLAITGTPIENSLGDLWSMMSICAPGLFADPKRFRQDYLRPIEQQHNGAVLSRLQRRIRPFMLRRTKDQVALDLPPKTEQVLHVPLHPKHRRLYDTYLARERQRLLGMLDDLDRNRFEVLQSLTTLRQLSLDASLVDAKHVGKLPSAKTEALVEQLVEIASEGHRALVFSQFTRYLRQVEQALHDAGVKTVYLDGRTRDRPRRIAEFTEGDAPAFLISLKAGGFGLNLTAADYVYVLDPWWNPATEAQAIDRTHRIGQERPVMVYRLISSDTIEEKVMALQQRKQQLFAAVMADDVKGARGKGAADATLGAITAEDIRELLRD